MSAPTADTACVPPAGATPAVTLLDRVAPVLIGAVFLLFFIGLSPFSDLADKQLLELVQASDAVANAIFIAASVIGLGLVTLRDPRGLLALARPPLVLLLGWLAFTAVVSPDAASAIRRLVFALITLSLAAVVPLLVRDLRQFAGLLLFGAGVTVALSWGGAVVAPDLAIHQLTDVGEANLAGAWRGVYSHKNGAGAMMVVFVFVGLYVDRKSVV